MKHARLAAATLAAALVAVLRPVVADAQAEAKLDAGRKHFVEVAKVLQSPRCMNCHPVGDAPLQGDKSVPHQMKISRRSNDAGLACQACHRGSNNAQLHGPPGVPGWHMPSASVPMVFEKKTVSELCVQIKDPSKNGGKSLEALLEHMQHDPLVLWGWSSGPGRSLPPMSHADFAEHAKQWIAAGAPCPP